jgi:hypothetical protein
MAKLNCWEFKNCGREKDGLLIDLLGECPVSTAFKFDGLNDGQGAGRACWMVENSCGRKSRRADGHQTPCCECEFYKRVLFEEEESTSFRFSSVPTHR